MAPIKNVIVIGASGGIGASVFKGITDSSKFNVSVLARQESENTYAANIKVFKSDYTEASLLEALKGQDAVVSILGPAGLGEQVKLIDAAVKTGVKLFIPSEFSINTLSDKARELVPLFEGKLDVIEYLKKQESKGLNWTAISAGPAFAYGLQLGLAGFNIQTHEALIFDGGNRVFSNSNLGQIGKAVVAVLSKPEATANEFIYIDSFTATQNEILAELETATGKKWNVTNTTSEAATKEGQELLGKGEIFPGLLMLLKTINLGDGFGSNFPKQATYANAKLGLPKQSLKESAAAVVAGGSI